MRNWHLAIAGGGPKQCWPSTPSGPVPPPSRHSCTAGHPPAHATPTTPWNDQAMQTRPERGASRGA
eukprot:8008483-Lingulodinium_polyedra.AAC.1